MPRQFQGVPSGLQPADTARRILAALLLIVSSREVAEAQSAQDHNKCDNLAASPYDEDRVVDGIALQHLDWREAIVQCAAAANRFPSVARFRFQLGRATYAADGHHRQAFTILSQAAEDGYAAAMFYVGSAYAAGDGVEKDFTKSFYWHLKAAQLDNRYAQSIVGLDYHVGRGVARDDAKAKEWLQVAAERGQVHAQVNLGRLLIEQHEYSGATRWCGAAANLEDAAGQYCLGRLHERGLGVQRDLEQARDWYQRAAQQGYDLARAALIQLNGAEQEN